MSTRQNNRRFLAGLALLIIFFLPMKAESFSGPTWLLSIPTAEVIPPPEVNVGFLHLDFGVTPGLELGIHGVKYQWQKESLDRPSLAVGFSLIDGPFIMVSRRLKDWRGHLGFKLLPYYLMAGIESSGQNKIKFLIEFNDGLNLGCRIRVDPQWHLDLGAGVGYYPLYHYGSFLQFYRGFPSKMDYYVLVGICYSFSLTE